MAEKLGLFTIGQFAAIHGINKKTLMWYDETGIFKPAVIRENGYRYYTHVQSSTLEAILMLRKLDVSIGRIREFLEHRSAEGLQALLQEQTRELEQRMARMRAMRRTLLRREKEVAALMELDLEEHQLVEREAEPLITLYTDRSVSWEQDVKTLVDEIRRLRMDNLYDASFGAMLPTDSLHRGDFSDYRAVFLKIPGAGRKKCTHVKPEGLYLQAYYQGDINRMADRYRALTEYARERGIVLSGYAYETVLNELTVGSPEEYITRIEIPAAVR